MISLETQKKIWIGILLACIFAGILFILWAVFLNHGTIHITAKSPYQINISGLRTVACQTDDCSTVVAPGDYPITIQKAGYRDETLNITVPRNGEYAQKIDLKYLPVIQELGEQKPFILSQQAESVAQNLSQVTLLSVPATPQELKNLPQDATWIIFGPDGKTAVVYEPQLISLYSVTRQTLTKLKANLGTLIFYDTSGQYLTYLSPDPQTSRQTLYLQHILQDGTVEDAIPETSFVRNFTKYAISMAPSGKKIAIIDQTDNASNLYIVDLEAKTRTSILEYPVIRDMKWLPGSDNFLFQAREQNSLTESIYLYHWDTAQITKLDLQTPLQDIVFLDNGQLMAATTQNIPGSDNTNLEGQLVTLAEKTATAEISEIGALPTATQNLAFINYSLLSNEARLIKLIPGSQLPQAVRISDDGKTLYYLQGNKVSALHFSE